MKRIGANKIITAAGLALLAVATWFASRPPSPPTLDSAIATSSPIAGSSSPITAPVIAPVTDTAAPIPAPKKITITITSPTSGARWVIGTENTISWSKAAGITGQLYLVNASNGAVAGWIQQSIGPAQTYFPWHTRDLYLSRTNPAAHDVVPGTYYIKATFSSPGISPAVSAPFLIITSSSQR